MIKVVIPYCLDRKYGKACNEAMSKYDRNDWVVIMDYDVMLLTPDTIRHINEYTQFYPDAGMFTCLTNRVGNKDQLINRQMSDNDSIRHHIHKARQMEQEGLYDCTELTKPVSGMLMVIKKSTWDHTKFNEDLKCLGVDNDYHKRLNQMGKKVLLMNGIYVWHTYRLELGVKNKKHLTAYV
jgi:GT2 family glycosyltransferase